MTENILNTSVNSVNIFQIDHQSQVKTLKHMNQLLTQQLQEMKFRYNNLKRQQEIWISIQGQMASKTKSTYIQCQQHIDNQQQSSKFHKQIQYLNQQLLNIINQRNNLQKINYDMKQKIHDLKLHNNDLKNLNQKINDIHKKQIQMILKDKKNVSGDQQVKKQNIILQSKLQQCKIIVKQMEDYYKNEINKILQQNQTLKQQLKQMRNNYNNLQQQKIELDEQLYKITNKFNKTLESIEKKQTQERQQQEISTLIKTKSKEKKWQLIIEQLKDAYERQINTLKDKIKFLLLKIQALEDNKCDKTFLQVSSSILNNSKVLSSKQSTQSYKFGALQSSNNTSFSSSIKQNLTKRDSNNMKTPNKYKQRLCYQKNN